MAIDDQILVMSDVELTRLHANALRLRDGDNAKQRNEAERILPLIEAERADRRAKAPPPVRKTPVRKAATKKTKAKEAETAS